MGFGSVSCKKRALQNKWVYRLKEEDGGKKRYKARLVIKGFAQKKGIEFDEIFSPFFKMTSIRTILSPVVVEDFHLEQLDVKTTFLHGDLEGRDLYATATRVWGQREGEFGLQVEEELVWIEIRYKEIVFEIW